MRECAVFVKDVVIRYKNLNVMSSKRDVFRRRKKQKEFEAVRGISFSVAKGEILGIIGENGCGKSTILRAIAGIYAPDEGIIETFDETVALMAIGVGFNNELTGRENILLSGLLLGVSKEFIVSKMEEVISFSELGDFIDRPVKTYSSGMHSKLAFSITSTIAPDVMLLDEVLSVGDEHFRKKSMQRMKELISDDNRTVIIVSHSISTLLELCDRVMWMQDGQIRKIGNTKEVLREYRKSME